MGRKRKKGQEIKKERNKERQETTTTKQNKRKEEKTGKTVRKPERKEENRKGENCSGLDDGRDKERKMGKKEDSMKETCSG